MPHKKRKVRKQRGSRTHGYGQIGQHRSGGGRGGHGKAGYDKHKWTQVLRYDPTYWEKTGFTPAKTKKTNIINIGDLADLADNLEFAKKLKMEEKKIFLDLGSLGYDKLLGKGKITQPILVKIAAHSETASRKLEEAGGQILKEEKE